MSQRARLSDFVIRDSTNPLDHYRNKGADFDAGLLKQTIWGEMWETKERMLKGIIDSDKFNHEDSIGAKCDQQYVTMLENILSIMSSGAIYYSDELEEQNSKIHGVIGDVILSYDLSFGTMMGVSTTLFHDTLLVLGTEKHRHYLQRIKDFELIGCFALTEIGHGTDVMGMETTATYNHETRSFSITSPKATSAKLWISCGGRSSTMAAVMAKLVVNGENHGNHAFCVEIRDENLVNAPGVIIGNVGEKVGVNGIDNAFIFFENFIVPYDALLDRFSQINEDGQFVSSMDNPAKRFGLMMSGLTRGRMSVVIQSATGLRHAIVIALRYAAIRKQFGSALEENRILDYPLHRYRLIPILANSLACSTFIERTQDIYRQNRSLIFTQPEHESVNEFHIILTAFKPLASWLAQEGIQECREACGGHGYSAYSRLGALRSNNDVLVTWEGDNNVIQQQISRFLLKKVRNIMSEQEKPEGLLSYVNIDSSQVLNEHPEFSSTNDITSEVLASMQTHVINYLIYKSFSKLQENVGTYPDLMAAWNGTQVHYLNDLSKAFSYHLGASVFWDQIQMSRSDPGTFDILEKFYKVFVISRLEKQLVILREYDYMSSAQGELLLAYLRELCFELGESSLRVAEAVSYPEKWIGSAIAKEDGQLYPNLIDAWESDSRWYHGAYPEWFEMFKNIREAKPKL